MEINCVIVDDEPLARDCMEEYISQVDFLKLAAVAKNAMELQAVLEKEEVKVVFMDIHMPIINGIDFIKSSTNLPSVILTTAYPQYALESYQLDVLDYLVKPITFDRFYKSALKVRDYHFMVQHSREASVNNAKPNIGYFFIKCDNKYEKILFEDVLFIESLQNYVRIHTQNREFITLLPLKTVETYLYNLNFKRVHKSYIVSIARIESIHDNHIAIGLKRIPISRNYRDVLIKTIHDNLWKKD
ncbi:LytR/AlgR family response regulator transcription factor [Flavobacterium sp. RHBU_24]|uniref:LytR/AlgR family response regulator transcription factor n=1 Tax=Flavobacterium sp. RHBU_24 TaxID=3391185 RepID=UPI003984C4F0